MEKVMEAVKEASMSIACCLDEVDDVTKQDLEHIQNQITILENYIYDIRKSWQPMDSKDGVAWFGGKTHYQLADYLPQEALEHNHEDLDFLVIGWRK